MFAEIGNNGYIRKTNVALKVDVSVLLVDGNCSAIIVDNEIVFYFQTFFFEQIFNAGRVNKTVVPVAQLPDGMVQGNKKPSPFRQVFF